MRLSPWIVVWGGCLVSPGLSAADSNGGVRRLSPEQLQYRSEPRAPGASIAVVAGDPASRGAYTLRVRFEAGVATPPHSHPDERVVTVLEGQYRFAVGTRFESDALVGYGPGSVLILPAGTAHFSAAGDHGAVVQESGTGPTALVPVPPVP